MHLTSQSSGSLPVIAEGVVTSGWSNGMNVPLGVTVDRGKVGLVIPTLLGDGGYNQYGHIYLGSDDAFQVFWGSTVWAGIQRLPWALLDLSRALRVGESVQRGRSSVNKASASSTWTTKPIALGTALGDFGAAYAQFPHFGVTFSDSSYPVYAAYPVVAGATTLNAICQEFTSGSTGPFYISWEVWPLKG